MACNAMCFRPKPSAAFTLVEVMVASALGLLTVSAVVMLSMYSSRSFAAIANYVNLDRQSQLALDKMSKEIRQAVKVTDCSPTSLSILDVDTNSVQFSYDPVARTLVRTSGDQ